jgi:hypothetical protein
MDGGVEILIREIEGAQPRGESERDLGVAGREIGQPRGEPMDAKGGQDGEREPTAFRVLREPLAGAGDLRQRGADLGGVILRGGGEEEALLFAPGKRDAQLAFERLQLARDGALRKVQFRGGGRGGAEAVERLQCQERGGGGQEAAGRDHEEHSSTWEKKSIAA